MSSPMDLPQLIEFLLTAQFACQGTLAIGPRVLPELQRNWKRIDVDAQDHLMGLMLALVQYISDVST